jgi:tRNA1Val (adenine37-N6)-methyltransferase
MTDELTLDTIGGLRMYQRREGYRFSIDSLLLASFVGMKRLRRAADFGAGAGIVGLLLALRYPDAEVTLVELQESLVALARRNIELGGLGARVTALHADIRALPEGLGAFDLVISNPPFRRPGRGLLSEGEERARARHELTLTLPDLAASGAAHLRHHGRFVAIHLPERLADLLVVFRAHGLEPKRMRMVHGRRESVARMVLVEAVRGGKPGLAVERPLIVYDSIGHYSDEVRLICGSAPRDPLQANVARLDNIPERG